MPDLLLGTGAGGALRADVVVSAASCAVFAGLAARLCPRAILQEPSEWFTRVSHGRR